MVCHGRFTDGRTHGNQKKKLEEKPYAPPNEGMQATPSSVCSAPASARLMPSVRLQRQEDGRQEADARRRRCDTALSGASSRSPPNLPISTSRLQNCLLDSDVW